MSTLDDQTKRQTEYSRLSGTEYQKQIFERLIEEIFDDSRVLTIENHAQGAVDYVVRERQGRGMLDTARLHYFECKNYSRTLELDNVAKIMVVAVADQPLSVHVVSRTPLQPQIKKYASRIFNVDTDSSPIFKSIVFRHWQTDTILRKTSFDDAQEPDDSGADEFCWWIAECSAFSETEVASSVSPNRHSSVRRGSLLLLTLELPEPYSGDVDLLGLPRQCWEPVASDPHSEADKTGCYLIDTGFLDAGRTYTVSVKVVRGVADIRIPLGHIHVSGVDPCLPEIRSKEIESLSLEIGSSGEYRLVLVEGEAGVGKTHLIEKVAEGLRARAGFDVMRFTVPEENGDGLMGTVVRNCLAPPIGRSSFEELTNTIEKALLDQAGGGTLETDFSLLARVASRMGPRVVVLRDCQHITAALADQIWTLIAALDDASWGGMRLVLEYRHPDARSNPALQSLIRKIRLKIRKVLLEKRVLALDETRFSSLARQMFGHVTEELIQCLLQRTGGLPLFIDSYLRRLQQLGLIVRDGKDALFSITQPAQILANVLPEGGQIILEGRVQTCLSDRFGSEWNRWAVALGLIAIAEDALGQSLIRDALDVSVDELRALQTALEIAEVGYGRPDGQIVFRHDLLREATVSVARAAEGFAALAGEVAKKLAPRISEANEVRIRTMRIKIFALLQDNVARELELRKGLQAAETASDYGRLVSFLTQILELLKGRSDVNERLDFMSSLAWATWVSDSLRAARERYLQLAEEAERCMDGDFSLGETVATDAYRRAIGIDLELVEPLPFLKNTINVLGRRQTPVTFNSILNRLVLFCARFGYPKLGYDFAKLAFEYIGDGKRENEGAVLCSELGSLYAPSAPDTALGLFRQALALAMDESERACNALEIFINECLYQGRELDLDAFGQLWKACSESRFSETLTRASLLRGSLLLRDGDLKNAGRWIERTATMVRLYHMKQFELAILNDQILHSLLLGNDAAARIHFADLVAEFERIKEQMNGLSPLVEQAYQATVKAAAKLPLEPSSIPWPDIPPKYCDPMGEVRGNIVALASLLGVDEVAERHASPPVDVGERVATGEHRLIKVEGISLILGAY